MSATVLLALRSIGTFCPLIVLINTTIDAIFQSRDLNEVMEFWREIEVD